MYIFRPVETQPQAKSDLDFDELTGKFIVKVTMTPKEYGIAAQEKVIADMDSCDFEKDSGLFTCYVYMSPEQYTKYVKEKVLPYR